MISKQTIQNCKYLAAHLVLLLPVHVTTAASLYEHEHLICHAAAQAV